MPVLTWGTDSTTLITQATVSMILFLFLALLMARGLRMADCLSRLITTVTKAQEYIACNLRNISSLQAKSPASHWTVMFHTASTGITMKVTSRSAIVRLTISTLTWDFRFPSMRAAHSTARLQKADMPQRMKVMITLAFAAVLNVGSWGATPLAVQFERAEEQLQLVSSWWSATSRYITAAGSHREAFIFWSSGEGTLCSSTMKVNTGNRRKAIKRNHQGTRISVLQDKHKQPINNGSTSRGSNMHVWTPNVHWAGKMELTDCEDQSQLMQ